LNGSIPRETAVVNRLERRTRLTACAGNKVELVATPAGRDRRHRFDAAGARIDGDDRRGRIIRCGEHVRNRRSRSSLQARIDRRVHLETALPHGVRAVLLLQEILDVAEEVRLANADEPLARLQLEARLRIGAREL
jgi:hypothetical protein